MIVLLSTLHNSFFIFFHSSVSSLLSDGGELCISLHFSFYFSSSDISTLSSLRFLLLIYLTLTSLPFLRVSSHFSLFYLLFFSITSSVYSSRCCFCLLHFLFTFHSSKCPLSSQGEALWNTLPFLSPFLFYHFSRVFLPLLLLSSSREHLFTFHSSRRSVSSLKAT